MAAAQPPQQMNMAEFVSLKNQMEQISAQRKTTKGKMDEIQKTVVKMMLHMNMRYVDESGVGTGPFWTLTKNPKEGSWRADRYLEFFTGILTEIKTKGIQYTPEQLTALAGTYLKQFEKRDLKIEKHTTAKTQKCDDLKQWLADGHQQ